MIITTTASSSFRIILIIIIFNVVVVLLFAISALATTTTTATASASNTNNINNNEIIIGTENQNQQNNNNNNNNNNGGYYLRTYPTKKNKQPNINNNNNTQDENNNNKKRRVWVHFKEGKRDIGIRNIQNAVVATNNNNKDNNNNIENNNNSKLNIIFDFPNVNSMVITATDDVIKNNLLLNDPNIIEKIIDDPIRESHHINIQHYKERRHLLPTDDDDGQYTSYGIDLLQVQDVWDKNIIGNDVTVCIIDSGIDITHDDLQQTKFTGDTLSNNNNNNNNNDNWDYDNTGHGTHITGIIAGNNNDIGIVGIAYGANIHIVKVFDEDGLVYSSAIIDAVYKCRDANAKIINLSLGGIKPIQTEQDIFTELYEQDGILTIASAGNNGSNTYSYPASYDNVLSIGAIDQNKDYASFSQYNDKIDLVGPGVKIWSTFFANSYIPIDGTSQAAPYIAGLAALLWSYNISAPVEHIYNAIIASAEDLGTNIGRDDYYGYGLPRANIALDILNATLTGTEPLQILVDGTTIATTTSDSTSNNNNNIQNGDIFTYLMKILNEILQKIYNTMIGE